MKDDYMGSEIESLVAGMSTIPWLKGLILTVTGYIVRILWQWEDRPSWPKFLAGLIFCVVFYILVDQWVHVDYQLGCGLFGGMLTSRIINFVFRFAKVQEDAIVNRSKRWWESDKKSTRAKH